MRPGGNPISCAAGYAAVTATDIEKTVSVMDETLESLLPLIEDEYSKLLRRK
jgi:hypothetical protein